MVARQMQMLASTMKLVSPGICSRSERRYGVILDVVNEPFDAVAPGTDGATDGVLRGTMVQVLYGSATTTEALVVAFRRTRCHLFGTASTPCRQRSLRSFLHHCLQRHGISRLPQVEEEKSDQLTAVLFLEALSARAPYRLTASNSQTCRDRECWTAETAFARSAEPMAFSIG